MLTPLLVPPESLTYKRPSPVAQSSGRRKFGSSLRFGTPAVYLGSCARPCLDEGDSVDNPRTQEPGDRPQQKLYTAHTTRDVRPEPPGDPPDPPMVTP